MLDDGYPGASSPIHQIRTAIKEFAQDMDVTEEHLDIVKSEMYGDLMRGLNR